MKDEIIPAVGMGATIQHWSDRTACTIISITHNGKRLILQADKVVRIDLNGISDSQNYSYQLDEQGVIFIATHRKDGLFRISKTKQRVYLGVRDSYHDLSF